MYLVTQGRGRINQLGFIPKTGEYVYLHKGKEIWREKGDDKLFHYFNEVRAGIKSFNDKDMVAFPVYTRYSDSCHQFEKAEHPEIYGYGG